jgi:hypothetical protein
MTFCTPIDEQEELHQISREDKIMARLYKVCDDARCPKYLVDRLVGVLSDVEGDFDLTSVTNRKSFFLRVHKKLETIPPEAIEVTLCNGEKATVYRFDFMEQLQRHLVSRVFADQDNIDLPNPEEPWSSLFPPDQRTAKHTSLVDSTWYHNTSTSQEHLLSTGQYALHPLVLYIDKTGTDGMQKMLTTGLCLGWYPIWRSLPVLAGGLSMTLSVITTSALVFCWNLSRTCKRRCQ